MLIVLPTCQHDIKLAIINLQHALRLEEGRQTEFECLLVVERSKDVDSKLKELEADSAALFSKVQSYYVDPYRGDPAWPRPQNHMWQRTARSLSMARIPHRWFWWEPDCVPLEKGWMSILAKAAEGQARPVAGAVASQPNIGHYLAGPAVYPPRASRYFPQALNATDEPWDIAASRLDGILGQTHDISHLIKHDTSREGTHFETMDDVRRLIPDGSILFHKCKDGSLAAVLAGRKPEPLGPGSVSQPSIHDQASENGWESGTFAFPHENGIVYFNPSVVRDVNGQLLMVTRRSKEIPGGSHSDLVICKVREPFMTVHSPIVPRLPRADQGDQWEDPKAIWDSSPDRMLISCAQWRHGSMNKIGQDFIRLSADMLTAERVFQPRLTFGGQHAHTANSTGHEKNWCPFWHDGKLWFVYSLNPHIVFRAEDGLHEKLPALPLSWPYGEPRGGTPPIKVGSEYITFFHSSLPWRKPKRRYFIGAMAFEAKPPFRPTRWTVSPILAGSEDDPRILGGPLCVFPNGADFKDNRWTIVLGVNDEQCAWLRMSNFDLDERLVPVELHPELSE